MSAVRKRGERESAVGCIGDEDISRRTHLHGEVVVVVGDCRQRLCYAARFEVSIEAEGKAARACHGRCFVIDWDSASPYKYDGARGDTPVATNGLIQVIS